MTKVFSEEQIKELSGFFWGGEFYAAGRPRCLTITEWKTPDTASIPPCIKNSFKVVPGRNGAVVDRSFITDFPSAYKIKI